MERKNKGLKKEFYNVSDKNIVLYDLTAKSNGYTINDYKLYHRNLVNNILIYVTSILFISVMMWVFGFVSGVSLFIQ